MTVLGQKPLIGGALTSDQPNDPEPDHRHHQPTDPKHLRRQFDGLRHHPPHGVGKKGIDRPFDDQDQAEGCDEVVYLSFPCRVGSPLKKR